VCWRKVWMDRPIYRAEWVWFHCALTAGGAGMLNSVNARSTPSPYHGFITTLHP
jgi:hypothetical protein